MTIKSKRNTLYTLCLFICLFALASADFEDIITKVFSVSTVLGSTESKYKYVSMNGGAYIYIKGSGFSTRSASSNRVAIGDLDCPVVEFLTTSTQVVCIAPPSTEQKSMPVKVFVDENRIGTCSSCYIVFNYWNTPLLAYMLPNAGNPQEEVSSYGRHRVTSSLDVDYIKIGDYRCDSSEQNEFDSVTLDGNYRKVPCNVPTIEAGYYNVSQKNLKNTGLATNLRSLPVYRLGKDSYDFAVVPKITSISNSKGSSEGQIITVKGTGFSSTNQNEVFLADTQCKILKESETEIECELQSRSTPIAEQGYHAGLKYAFYKGKDLTTVKAGTAGAPTWTKSRLSAETDMNIDDTFTSKLSGYFKAPVTGNYKFVVSADDRGQLLFSKTPSVKTGLEVILDVQAGTPYRFFNRYSTYKQTSDDIALIAGNYYYMELLHQEYGNDDFATIGVIIPNNENTVNTIPQILSIKLTCPTIFEKMEFKLTNSTGGKWRIRLDYLSSDGKKIDSTTKTSDMAYNAAASAVSTQIQNVLGLKNTVTRELLKGDGTVTTVESEAKTFRYEVTFLYLRKNGMLPVIEKTDLTGSQVSVKVTQLREPSAPIRGTFTLSAKGKTSQMNYNIATWDMETKIRELGYSDPIRVVQNNDVELGGEWRVQFSGDKVPFDPVTISHSLTGCSDPSGISADINALQAASNDLFYEVIPVDYLFTAEQKSQITIQSNGVNGNCPGYNCDYTIQDTNLPEVTASSYTAPTLTLSVDGVTTGQYVKSDIRVFFGNVECSVNDYTDSTIPASLVASCPTPEAGDFTPKVHFAGLGYAKTASSVSTTSIDTVISAVAPNKVNPNGGTVLTITGSGFPASADIANQRSLQVKIGSADCKITSVTPTQIICTNTPVTANAALTVSLNGKSGASSVLTLLDTVPSINSVTPNSVNPVLQTDITITGANFDSNAGNTKIYLSNSTNSQVTECLPISSVPTQIKCKLLGAPTGTYNIYVKTSAGFSDSKPFAVKTVVTSVSPSSGSTAGGTVLTIQGGSFSSDKQQTLVFVGSENIACDVISSSESQVQCKTTAKPASYDESPQEIVVATRIVEEAICDNGATCSFSYSDALTPKVTAFSATTVVPGDSLDITGTGFESQPTGSIPIVKINSVVCDVVSNTDTQISVTVPAGLIPNKAAIISVNIAGKGDAQFSSVSNNITITPKISSISPSSGSSTGNLITVTGAGFQPGAIVKVGTSTCAIRSLTPTTITCRATATGEISLTYNDFASIKCNPACKVASGGASSTPTVTSVSPLTPPVATAFSLTIVGTRFNLGAVTVNLVSKTDSNLLFTGSITSSTATQIEASFTNVAAGGYNVEVLSGPNVATSTVVVDIPLTATISSPVESSISGGVTLTIAGSGFFSNTQKDKNKVSVCGFPCKVTQSAADSIQCETPLFMNSAVKSSYSDLVAPTLIKAPTAWSDTGKQDTVLDLAFTTTYSSSKTDCQIGFDFGAGLLADLSEIKYFPDPATTASKLSGTVIEGSNDNTTFTNVATIDANAHDGWNSISIDATTPVRYRYYRLRGDTSTAKCALAEVQFFGTLLSDSTATDLDALNCKAQVTVNDKVQEIANAVNYKQSKTAVLTSISPEMGTTAGGTTLTLTGTGFISTTSDIKISIDGVPCAVSTASSTEITCVTGAAPAIANRRSSLKSELTVQFAGQGNVVIGKNKFFYIDKWSEMSTWGGITPPREGESVSIPAGQTVLLDMSPPKLKAIIIEGALIFDDKNIDLDCEYIFIRKGRLQIGTRENPIQNKITVTLHGTKESPQLPTFGNKVIAMMEGILDIHGKERNHTWTMLDRTANAGDTSIILQEEVDWTTGEEIVIASTEHDHYLSESRKILAATKNSGKTTLTFADPLKYKHYAGIQTIDGQTFEMRAEVGLLTRNVVIQGDESSEKLKYGVHIMAHSSTGDDSSIARISYTEVRQAGQAFNLGRYAIHFHLIGNVRESYVLGNAIHHTYNRAVTIHGVHFLRVQKNVAYWVMGHTIFIEDGIETHNVIEDNLVINTMASNSLLNTDQTPASFWITNPNNIWRRNHAAGSDRYGFWFDLREHPEGPSATNSICPTGEKLGEFLNNQAHSCGRYGLRIFHELIPRTYPCLDYADAVANPPIQAVFENFLGWKNMRDAIIGERLGAVKFKNIKAADNRRAGIEISDGNRSPPDTLLVEDAWIVGKTPENAGDDSVYAENNSRGLITPKVDFFLAKNVHFSNFGFNMTAIETCSHCEHPAATDSGARTSFFQGLTFNNVDQRVRFNVPYKEILVDRDGSLTGNTGSGVVTFYYEHLDVPGCIRNENVYNGLACDSTVTVRRVEFYGTVPMSSFSMQNLEILRVESNTNNATGRIPYRSKTNKSWATPFVTGFTYKLSWASRADFTEVFISPSEVINVNDKAITLAFNHSEYRELYDVIPQKDKTNITNTTTLWNTASANSLSTGDWHHDVSNQLLYVVVNGKRKQDIDIQAVKCRVNCPQPESAIPKDGATRLWSNITQWPNQRLPQDGEDVVIPGDWTLKLDVNSAKLGTLHVKGDLYFDDSKDGLVLTAERIWVQGQMFIGTSSARFTKKAKVVLTGLRKSDSLILGGIQDVSNKVLAVTGNLTMFGALVNNVYVRLQAPAKKDATSIRVPSTVDWKVGDEIVISPTQRAYNESEVRKIQAINNGVITLDSPLNFYHFGANAVTQSTSYGDIDMRAEVGLLTRNVVVEGSVEDSWGGRIYVGEIYDSKVNYYYKGRLDLDGVEMKNFGQKDTTLAGLTFDRVASSNNDVSVVKRCVVRDSLGWEMKVVGSTDITVEDTIFYRSYKIQVMFEGDNKNIKFRNNLMIMNEDRGLKTDKGDNSYDFGSSFYAEATFRNSEISGNIISGCNQQCWFTLAGDCSAQADGPYTVFNNTAHSGQVGWLVKNSNEKCTGITHFTGYKLEQGVATMFAAAQLQSSNLIISDTQKGISLNLGGVSDTTTISLKNSYVAGNTPTGDLDGYANKDECSKLAGVLLPVSLVAPKIIPPMPSSLPWYKVKTNHIWQSTFTMTGVTFENFADDFIPGCKNNFAIQSNHYASDASASTKLSGLILNNVAENNRIFFENPDNAWIGVDDCGGWFCTGISNIMVRDLDGSLMGRPSSIMPANAKILDPATCTRNEKENANICKDKGWGLLTFESLDIDVLTRILSPVKVTSTNYENKLNSYMDHVWDGFYTGLKRYSRFHASVQSGKQYKVEFTGTLPNGLRWGLQDSLPTEKVTVSYGYANPQSVKVTDKTGKVLNPTIAKLTEDKVIKPSDPCGTNIYNLDTRQITIQLTGEDNCRLDIVLTNAVKATVRYAMTVDEFFAQDGPAAFIDKMAAILKINPASIRIVDVKSGSTIINFFIDSSYQENTPAHDVAARAEMSTMINTLNQAASSGELRILNSTVLNTSFDMSLLRPTSEESKQEVITSESNIVIIIIAAVVGVFALSVGSYFAYKKYTKKRIVPGDIPVTKGAKVQPDNSVFMHTENPLVSTSRMELSQMPSTIRDMSHISPIQLEADSPEKP